MTAEIAIMNKTAVALAADSAVTIEQEKGQKIFNTVNKLFALSKYHPVGIMIYGSANFMDVPWESIIKIYRAKLGKQSFPTLKEYSDSFISFLSKNIILFPETEQKKYFFRAIAGYFIDIKREIDEQVKEKISCDKKITETSVNEIVEQTIRKHYEVWNKAAKLNNISADYDKTLIENYSELIIKAKDEIFQQLPISEKTVEDLQIICASIFSKDRFARNSSGLVIAGFGEEETFPALVSFTIEAKVNNALKYKKEKDAAINVDSSAWIIPFAQSEMVATFIEGVDPGYNKIISDYLSEYFEKYPDFIVDSIENVDATKKQEFSKKLKEIGLAILSDFNKKLQEYRQASHISPITSAVSFLPKDELAAMAESLVNLTSFKRKISLDAETVGGPIDVAVISKGDGFIWIKRKHYFKPELNTGFFANYFRKNREEQENEKA
ncbi:MAG: hypothetical protein CO148_03580 [Nitrospirae bacterium CG_4_9_14_3_um_filter_41_27]|nr:MAG: hypothetical protein COV68_00865 [Nitrospirae bacterium CG11_big_fil_rev_8_21_14_0_20_41_14]PJA80373.1 MAG: hypothetical protein CO148_03580 [Nitrospirae bacterium CG_4_9_14_3_um_filter_41_27]